MNVNYFRLGGAMVVLIFTVLVYVSANRSQILVTVRAMIKNWLDEVKAIENSPEGDALINKAISWFFSLECGYFQGLPWIIKHFITSDTIKMIVKESVEIVEEKFDVSVDQSQPVEIASDESIKDTLKNVEKFLSELAISQAKSSNDVKEVIPVSKIVGAEKV